MTKGDSGVSVMSGPNRELNFVEEKDESGTSSQVLLGTSGSGTNLRL